ncbi:hypothetical protein BGZ83_002592 [Gryganskiella cystojenkinii]|nr:hypothetical protein BGZ83_002592 [Gryganskiella cystojenkinii]
MTRIFAQSQIQATPSKVSSNRIPFRPQPTKTVSSTATTTATDPAAQDPASISGLRFCLHMVAFSAPGIYLAKKLSDGEQLPDMMDRSRSSIMHFIDSFR